MGEVADEGGALTLGGLSQCPTYLSGMSKADVQKEFKKQIDVFVSEGLDFLLCEYFEHIEEIEWAIEECLKTSLPVAANMCIGPEGDMHGVSAAECAIRMAKAGAHVVGINCHFDPFVSLECLRKMKAGLDAAGLKPYLMCQPLAFHTPDASGRPFCPSMSCPDNWGVTKGDAILVQQQEATRKEQIEEVQKIQMEKLKM